MGEFLHWFIVGCGFGVGYALTTWALGKILR
jgi:hypothetical protein